MRTRFLLFLVMLAVLSATAFLGTAMAIPITIDFSTGVGTDLGSLSYAGGANPLIGTNIPIGAVSGVGTPSNALVTDTITSGLLSFVTGNFLSYNAAPRLTASDQAPRSRLRVVVLAASLLVAAAGTPPIPLPVQHYSPEFRYLLAGLVNLYITTGTDTMDPKLVRFFGENPAAVISSVSGSVHATLASGGGGAAFTATSTHSTEISAAVAPVPEPPSLTPSLQVHSSLLGIGT